jgi:hypothetical protein
MTTMFIVLLAIAIALTIYQFGYDKGMSSTELKRKKHKASICDNCGLHEVFWNKWNCDFATDSYDRRHRKIMNTAYRSKFKFICDFIRLNKNEFDEERIKLEAERAWQRYRKIEGLPDETN